MLAYDVKMSMAEEVFPAVQNKMLHHIIEDVYEVYDPSWYITGRRYIWTGADAYSAYDDTDNSGLMDKDNIRFYIHSSNGQISMSILNETLGARFYKSPAIAKNRNRGKRKIRSLNELIEEIRHRRSNATGLLSRNAGRPIAEVIETGYGYDVRNWEYDGVPRPFMKNTAKDLEQNKDHIKAFVYGMRAKGYDIK